MFMQDLRAGVWRHYRGQMYLVLGYGHDANYADRDVVVYVGLELNDQHTGPRLAIRTVADFFSWVNPRTGETVKHDPDNMSGDYAVQRFTYVSPGWNPK